MSFSGQLETNHTQRRCSGSPSNVSNGTSGAHIFSSRAQLCMSGFGHTTSARLISPEWNSSRRVRIA